MHTPTRDQARRTVATLVVGLASLILVGVALQSSGVPLRAQEEEEPAAPTTVISPVAGNWSLLVNLGPAADPAALLASVDDWVTAAFAFDPVTDSFHTYRRNLPALSDLQVVGPGQAFWVFVPPDRLEDDLTFWSQEATVRNQVQRLQPGFNLAAWTGSDRVRISLALTGLPVRRAFSWDPVLQRFDVWDPALPLALQKDFELEYGQGLWLELGGAVAVDWEQP